MYLGLALTDGFYWHRVYRLVTVVRGSYVSAIYHKTTAISITDLDNSAAVTLMSTDVERIVLALQKGHEIWANMVQVVLSTYLLSKQSSSLFSWNNLISIILSTLIILFTSIILSTSFTNFVPIIDSNFFAMLTLLTFCASMLTFAVFTNLPQTSNLALHVYHHLL